MRVCIGGTFDILHKGHKTLIKHALRTAGSNGFLFIGVTTDKMTRNKKNVKPFEQRKRAISEYLYEKKPTANITIKPIKDKYGPTLEKEFDAIIVSPETLETAEEINDKRTEIGKKPLKIIKIPFVLAEDGKPISSSRIKKGEIDTDGKILV